MFLLGNVALLERRSYHKEYVQYEGLSLMLC